MARMAEAGLGAWLQARRAVQGRLQRAAEQTDPPWPAGAAVLHFQRPAQPPYLQCSQLHLSLLKRQPIMQ